MCPDTMEATAIPLTTATGDIRRTTTDGAAMADGGEARIIMIGIMTTGVMMVGAIGEVGIMKAGRWAAIRTASAGASSTTAASTSHTTAV